MRRSLLPVAMVALLFLAACGPQQKERVELATFIGGSEALAMGFSQLRPEVFDGGQDPFDVVVRLENKGEWPVEAAKAKVRLNGINPSEFGKLPEDFAKNPPDDLPAVTRTSRSPPLDVEFRELNYLATISGAALPAFPLVATACYGYGTNAVSKVCVRRDILNPSAGLCAIEGDKPVSNSGAPVHIANFREQARARDRIAFVFDVVHAGLGVPYELGSQCVSRQVAGKVRVKVDTRIPGLSCTGLNSEGSVAQGTVTLVDGTKTVSCTQPIAVSGDYEQVVNVELQYDYEDQLTSQLTVKHAGG